MKNSNKKGFTLVELVVVIAIIGVLAAILVPSMMGYVKKSRVKTANGNAKTAYNAAAEAFADLETQGKLGKTVTNAVPSGWQDSRTVTEVKISNVSTDADKKGFVAYKVGSVLAENGEGSGRFQVVAGVTSATTDSATEKSFTVLWHKEQTDSIVGRYPNPPADVDEAEKLITKYPDGNA